MRSHSKHLAGSGLPHRLADLGSPPRELYLRGELPRGPAVAIVGTRRPTAEALKFTGNLARELAHRGVAVLSGGARGIDTAAHEGALDAGGATVVVAPAGFERPFPERNRELFARVVAAGGAYLSLAPDERPATSASFFPRNACLVALAHVVVVVEAPFRSGARNAARWARRLGRPLLVVPGAPWSAASRGCLLELRRGALLCEGPRDVLAELSRQSLVLVPTASAPDQQLALGLDQASGTPHPSPSLDAELGAGRAGESDRERVLRAFKNGARHLDEICARTGLSVPVAQCEILTLALEGVLSPPSEDE